MLMLAPARMVSIFISKFGDEYAALVAELQVAARHAANRTGSAT